MPEGVTSGIGLGAGGGAGTGVGAGGGSGVLSGVHQFLSFANKCAISGKRG